MIINSVRSPYENMLQIFCFDNETVRCLNCLIQFSNSVNIRAPITDFILLLKAIGNQNNHH